MRILIAGPKNSGQRELLKLLTDREFEVSEGLVVEHTFQTRYFNSSCTLWVDEFQDGSEWAREFASDTAREVRDALTLFILTFDRTPLPDVSCFTSLLGDGKCVAVSMGDLEAESPDIEVVEKNEIVQIVHSALYDQNDEEPELEPEAAQTVDVDLDRIAEQLKSARNSTMSDDEKRALVDRIVDQLDL